MSDSIRLPQYRKVYEALRSQIESRTYIPGDLLPSEKDLSALYDVARPTVRVTMATFATLQLNESKQQELEFYHFENFNII